MKPLRFDIPGDGLAMKVSAKILWHLWQKPHDDTSDDAFAGLLEFANGLAQEMVTGGSGRYGVDYAGAKAVLDWQVDGAEAVLTIVQ